MSSRLDKVSSFGLSKVLVSSAELALVYQHLSCAGLKIIQDRKLLNRKGVCKLFNDTIFLFIYPVNRSILIHKTGPGCTQIADFQLPVLLISTFPVSVLAHGKYCSPKHLSIV